MPKGRVVCGVYLIENPSTGKVLVGSSVDVWSRLGRHRRRLEAGTHWNRYLQAAYIKAGGNFQYRLLEICNPDILVKREQHWMDRLRSRDRRYGYNLTDAGRTVPSPDGRRRISASRLGKTWEQIMGDEKAARAKAKLRTMTGEKNQNYHNRGAHSPFYGKTHIERFGEGEAARIRNDMSRKLKGRKRSLETRARISAAHAGKTLSEEHRRRIGEGLDRHAARVGKRTYKEMYADKADDLKARISRAVSQSTKGKTWEDASGIERAAERRRKLAQRQRGANGRFAKGGN